MFPLHSVVEVHHRCATVTAASVENANCVLCHLSISPATSKSFKLLLMKIIFKGHYLSNTEEYLCIPTEHFQTGYIFNTR